MMSLTLTYLMQVYTALQRRNVLVDLPRFSGEALAYCAACFSN